MCWSWSRIVCILFSSWAVYPPAYPWPPRSSYDSRAIRARSSRLIEMREATASVRGFGWRLLPADVWACQSSITAATYTSMVVYWRRAPLTGSSSPPPGAGGAMRSSISIARASSSGVSRFLASSLASVARASFVSASEEGPLMDAVDGVTFLFLVLGAWRRWRTSS